VFDMHSHILPAIDDGAKNLETSLAMLSIACQNKTSYIMATPHVIEGEWLPPWEKIVAECDFLQEQARKKGLEINICPGGEVAMSLDILNLITGPGPYCLNGGNYMLVELPAMEIPSFADNFFFTLQTKGIKPILAHPERHPVIMQKPQILADWINRGILAQLNATSLAGKMGEKVRKTAKLLLINNMVHVLGSDAHTTRTRRPDLTEAIQIAEDLIGEKATRKIIKDNPLSILAGEDIFFPKIIAKKVRGNFFLQLLQWNKTLVRRYCCGRNGN